MTSTTNNNTSQNGITLDAHRDLFQEFGFSTLLEQYKQDSPPTFKNYISHLPGNLDEVINSQALAKKSTPLEDADIEAELQMSLSTLLTQTVLDIVPMNFQPLDENQLRGFVLQPTERKRKHKHKDGTEADKKQKKKKKEKKDKKQKEKKEKKDKKDKRAATSSVKSQYSSPSGSSYTNSPFTPSPMLSVQEQPAPSPLVSITTNSPMQF